MLITKFNKSTNDELIDTLRYIKEHPESNATDIANGMGICLSEVYRRAGDLMRQRPPLVVGIIRVGESPRRYKVNDELKDKVEEVLKWDEQAREAKKKRDSLFTS